MPKTIDEMWQAYSTIVLDTLGICGKHKEIFKTTFFSGAYAYRVIMEDGPTEEVGERLDALNRDVDIFRDNKVADGIEAMMVRLLKTMAADLYKASREESKNV